MSLITEKLNDWREISNYVDGLPIAIDGQEGSRVTISSIAKLKLKVDNSQLDKAIEYYNNSKCRPPWNSKDLAHKIADAYGEGSNGSTSTTGKISRKIEIINKYDLSEFSQSKYSTEEFLHTLFPNCTFALAYPNENKVPCNFEIYNSTDIKLPRVNPYGVYVSLNPLKNNSKNLANNTIAEYRYVLVDMDSAERNSQYNMLKQTGLPYTAIVDSGGRGLHVWVPVNAADAEEFKDKSNRIQDILEPYCAEYGIKLDRQVTNRPAGWCRLGGAFRGDKEQKVLYLNNSVEITVEEWLKSKEFDFDHLFQDTSLYVTDQPIIDKFSRPFIGEYIKKGSVWTVCSQTGMGKSVLTMQMATSLSAGKAPLGLKYLEPISPIRVTVIQAEDNPEKNRQIVYSTVREENLDVNLVCKNLKISDMVEWESLDKMEYALNKIIDYHNTELLIINPLNRYFQGDFIKDHTKMVNFTRLLKNLCLSKDISILLVTHTAKPSEERQALTSLEDKSNAVFGSSLWCSFLRNIIVLDQTKEPTIRKLYLGKGMEDMPYNERIINLKMSNPPTKYFTIHKDDKVDCNEIELFILEFLRNNNSNNNNGFRISEIIHPTVTSLTIRKYLEILVNKGKVNKTIPPSNRKNIACLYKIAK